MFLLTLLYELKRKQRHKEPIIKSPKWKWYTIENNMNVNKNQRKNTKSNNTLKRNYHLQPLMSYSFYAHILVSAVLNYFQITPS